MGVRALHPSGVAAEPSFAPDSVQNTIPSRVCLATPKGWVQANPIPSPGPTIGYPRAIKTPYKPI